MKSICIKITNSKTTKYLLEKLNNFELDEIYFSYRKFKIFENIIIHYKGKNEKLFLKQISKMLSIAIIDLFEENIIEKLINSEYFYFDGYEQSQIMNITFEDLYNKEESLYTERERFNLIYNNILNYLLSNNSIVLKGFITFRIKNYFEILLKQIDKSVNKYIIEKEYSEFISLLKIYVNSKPSTCNLIHLIYSNSKPILLDENKNVIKKQNHILETKYLSDISFSSNDHALNTLLDMLPQKINIHLIDNECDEFINTLKLIFENRIIFCKSCSICKSYKKSPAMQS